MRLEGKVALITGAASGIGRQTALLLASEGARIAGVDVSSEANEETAAMVREAGGDIIALQADISNAGDCERMVAATEEHFGKLDVLFNNAGAPTPLNR